MVGTGFLTSDQAQAVADYVCSWRLAKMKIAVIESLQIEKNYHDDIVTILWKIAW